MKDKNGEKGKIIKKRIKKLTFYDPNGREIGVFEGDLQSCTDLMVDVIKDKIAEAREKKGKLNLRR